jgi:hypothetical protein
MLLTLQLILTIKKGHTPSITTVTITVYLKENGKKNFYSTSNLASRWRHELRLHFSTIKL